MLSTATAQGQGHSITLVTSNRFGGDPTTNRVTSYNYGKGLLLIAHRDEDWLLNLRENQIAQIDHNGQMAYVQASFPNPLERLRVQAFVEAELPGVDTSRLQTHSVMIDPLG